jgi:hypothetical protein
MWSKEERKAAISNPSWQLHQVRQTGKGRKDAGQTKESCEAILAEAILEIGLMIMVISMIRGTMLKINLTN